MESKYTIAVFIALIYFIIKYVEMRFIVKEIKPIKIFLRDTIIVFLSVILGITLFDKIEPLSSVVTGKTPFVFTNEPDF